jgi:VanZ family protein
VNSSPEKSTIVTTSRPFFRNQLPALIWAGLIFIESAIPGENIPDVPIFSQDKLIHFGIYLVLAYLVYRALFRQLRYPWLQSRALMATLLVVALFGASDEFHQLFVPGRSCDFFDWTADTLGGCAMVAVLFLKSRFAGPKARPADPV